jgi:hypothetical protein
MLTLLYKALDVLLAAFGRVRRVRVLVHSAWHVSLGEPCFFVNVTNLSSNRDVEITHVWVESAPNIPVLNGDRPLPRRLKPDESWETWLSFAQVPSALLLRADTCFRVRLSTGRLVHSKANTEVPPIGEIPGGAKS